VADPELESQCLREGEVLTVGLKVGLKQAETVGVLQGEAEGHLDTETVTEEVSLGVKDTEDVGHRDKVVEMEGLRE